MYSQSHSLKNVKLADKRALHKGPGRGVDSESEGTEEWNQCVTVTDRKPTD